VTGGHDDEDVLLSDETEWQFGARLFAVVALASAGLLVFIVLQLFRLPSIPPSAMIGLFAGCLALALIAGSAVVFRRLTVVVTRRALTVRFGSLGPTIPIRAIRSVVVEPYDAMRWGGWGIRGLGRRQAFSTTGVERGVRVLFDKNGVEHVLFVTSTQPEAIADAITRAQQAERPEQRDEAVALTSVPHPATHVEPGEWASEARLHVKPRGPR
jgi:hypothetical protein